MLDPAIAYELLRGLVAVPSLSRQEAVASAWLVEQMHALGYERAFVDDAGNAVGEMGPENASHTIILLGHIDTVPGNIPVRIEASATGPVLYGRGSVDATGITPRPAVIPNTLRLRDDVVDADPLTGGNRRDAVLANAPAAEHGFFGVPKVIE